MTVPNVGDVLMLSQVAWKTGRAFTAGRKDAPPDLQAVETDISSVAHALKQLAETLRADTSPSLVSRSDPATQNGVAIIISSCHQTIHDLDSLIDRYQVIRKHRTPGGFAIERSWSDLVLAQYETILWTTEGGTLHDLSNLLQMHTKSIRLLAEAVQSGSLSQLEGVVTPMAKRFDSMYDLPGSLEDQLEEVSRFVQELTLVNPISKAPPIPQRNPARSPTTEISDPLSSTSIPFSPPAPPSRRTTTIVQSSHTTQPPISVPSTMSSSTKQTASPILTGERTARTPTTPRKHVSEFSFGGSPARDSASSYASSTSSVRSRGSSNSRHALVSVTESIPLSWAPEPAESIRPNTGSLTLPPPSSKRSSSTQSSTDLSREKPTSTLSPSSPQQDSIADLHRSSTTASQKAAFEKEAFRNSAILCDVRGTLVEYSQNSPSNPHNPHDMADTAATEILPVCTTCRIAIVRKRTTTSPTITITTSIWVLSADNTTRLELPLNHHTPTYASYFSATKISLTTHTPLRFHPPRYGARLHHATHSPWVTFVFATAHAATQFQTELAGRTLLASLRTTQTLRVRDGPLARFGHAHVQQMCALERMRVWEDEESGAVVAMVHFSAGFCGGWLKFCVNSRYGGVKVVDAGRREVRVRGLDMCVGRGGGSGGGGGDCDADTQSTTSNQQPQPPPPHPPPPPKTNKTKTTIIKTALITFASPAEKHEFLALVKEYQSPGRLCDGDRVEWSAVC